MGGCKPFHRGGDRVVRMTTTKSPKKSRPFAALAENLAKRGPNLTDEELAVFEEDARLARMSQETADTLCRELARHIQPEEDPKVTEAFLESFAAWVVR